MANIANVVNLDFPTFAGPIVTVQDAAIMIREPIAQPQFVTGDPDSLTETSSVF